ncbi:diguanylate cyclase [Candidatus Desantisbacteria bacterium]|nr:diguanylate cyclase [Candidatus Desantisbacteria bacterium]
MLIKKFQESLQFKFVSLALIIVVFGGIIAGTVLVSSNIKLLRKTLTTKGRSFANYIAEIGQDPLISKNYLQLDDIVSTINHDPEVAYAFIQDNNNRIVTSFFASLNLNMPELKQILSVQPKEADLAYTINSIKNKTGINEISYPISIGNETVGKIIIGMSEQEIRKQINKLIYYITMVSISIFIFILFLLILSQGILTKPIKDLAILMKNISIKKDYSIRTAVKRKDEIGLLSNCFNYMLEQIQKRDTELELHGIDMENKVAKRTEELSSVNKELQNELHERKIIEEKMQNLMIALKEISIRDSLTKLYNHGYFRDALTNEFSRAKRYGQNITCLMLDIDYFKKINDTYGHLFGDKVLVEIADCIKKCIRESDILARYGGEEFSILLIESDYGKALIISEKIRTYIESREFKDADISAKLTVSIGLSSLFEDGVKDKDKLLGFSDLALYSAKMAGRNNIVMYKNIKNIAVMEEMKIKHLEDKIFEVEEPSTQSYLESIRMLISAYEKKDPYMREHSLNVFRYVLMIADEMHLQKNETAIIGNAAILHDLGKITIPDEIIFKKEELSEEEYSTIKQHPVIAFNILRKTTYVRHELDIILHHHEWFDGKGYPIGLKGKLIPLGARIIAVADSYDAMKSFRTYRNNTITQESILITLAEKAGTQFDPEVVYAFFNSLDKNGLWPSTINIKQRLEQVKSKIV